MGYPSIFDERRPTSPYARPPRADYPEEDTGWSQVTAREAERGTRDMEAALKQEAVRRAADALLRTVFDVPPELES